LLFFNILYYFNCNFSGCKKIIIFSILIQIDFDKQLKIIKNFCFSMDMTINIDKIKIIIIKLKMITYVNFRYANNNVEEVILFKYLEIYLHQKLNWNYSIEKKINGGWKAYYGLENSCKLVDLWFWDKKKLLCESLIIPISLYRCEVWNCNISRES
jgi:hypothetical protein